MLDPESVINIMYASIYVEFLSHILHYVDMLVQLVDHSLVRPLRVVKDVFVKVNGLIFPFDFYVIDVNAHSLPLIYLCFQVDLFLDC